MTLLADSPAGLPSAVDPTALSLNENPYPPLPAVRSALIAALEAANRYPEFLPEQLRRVIAARIGVPATQVILGAGATGVILQVLHALTSPGDRIVMAESPFGPATPSEAPSAKAAVPESGGGFDLNDFLAQISQMKKMGGLSGLIDKLPSQIGRAHV